MAEGSDLFRPRNPADPNSSLEPSDWNAHRKELEEELQNQPLFLSARYLGDATGYLREVRGYLRSMSVESRETNERVEAATEKIRVDLATHRARLLDELELLHRHQRVTREDVKNLQLYCQEHSRNLPKGPRMVWALDRITEIIGKRPWATAALLVCTFLLVMLSLTVISVFAGLGLDLATLIETLIHGLLG